MAEVAASQSGASSPNGREHGGSSEPTTTGAPEDSLSAEPERPDEPRDDDEKGKGAETKISKASVNSEAALAETSNANGAKRRRVDAKAEGRARGSRMMGVLMGTLNSFKEDSAKRLGGEKMKRRQEVEERLQEKLKRDAREAEEKERLVMEEKMEKHAVLRLEEEIRRKEATYRARHSAKLRLSNYLVTSSPSVPRLSSPSDSSMDVDDGPTGSSSELAPLAPYLPYSLPPPARARANPEAAAATASMAHVPLYYRPFKLTEEQEEALEKQKKRVEEEVRKSRERWQTERRNLEDQLTEAKESVKRREAEKARRPGPNDSSAVARERSDAKDDGDAEMNGTPPTGSLSSAADKQGAAAAAGESMEVDESQEVAAEKMKAADQRGDDAVEY